MGGSRRRGWPLGIAGLLACEFYEPPPDVEPTTSTSGDEGGGDDPVVNDGLGNGVIFFARLRDTPTFAESPTPRNAIVIGAPDESWDGVTQSGQVSIVLDSPNPAGTPAEVIVLPEHAPHTIVEDLHSSACADEQQFAWDLLEHRHLGGAMSFVSLNLGIEFAEYENMLLVAAPTAGADSGRVMTYINCQSCALFPKPDGGESLLGGRFGASVTVGLFAEAEERVAIGAPLLAEDGRVAILRRQNFDRWRIFLNPESTLRGVRECQCEFSQTQGNHSCLPWDETLQGSFPTEEFGATMTAGDLDCDGFDELIVGAPGADLPAMDPPQIVDAGAVYVYFNAPKPLGESPPTILRQGTPEVGGDAETGDRFGSVFAVGNFSGARRLNAGWSCFSVAVGTPNEDEGTGQVQIFEGGPDGLTYGGPVIVLDEVFDAVGDPGDRFGFSLLAADLNRDGFDDLVVGAPGDVGGGSITIIPGTDQGLDLDDATWFAQGQGVEGDNVAGDEFGYALTAIRAGQGTLNSLFILLAVGAPGENNEVGMVNLYRADGLETVILTGDASLMQNAILGDLLTGDRFGSTLLQPRAMPDLSLTRDDTTMKPFAVITCTIAVALMGCHPGPIDGDSEAAAQDDSPTRDLPDEGVVGDPWNCGELGLKCIGPLGIGECIDDECQGRLGPDCLGNSNAPTCNDYCETYDLSCAYLGCEGATVWGWNGDPDWADGMCGDGDKASAIPLPVACDEPLEGQLLVYNCCCDHPG